MLPVVLLLFQLPRSAAPSSGILPPLPSSLVQPIALQWVRPHELLLDNDRGAVHGHRRSDFGNTPAVLDAALVGDCVMFVVPAFQWRAALHSREGVRVRLETHRGETPRRVAFREVDEGGTLARRSQALVFKRCSRELLRHRSSVPLTLMLNASLRVRTSVLRDPSEPRQGGSRPSASSSSSIAACTLFSQPDKFATWVEYMWSIGVDRVYGYYNGNLTRAAALAQSGGLGGTGQLHRLAALQAAGALTLVEWDHTYNGWYGRRGTGRVAQAAAMHSCIWRFQPRHKWILLLDDDEYPYVEGGQSLGRYLEHPSRAALPCIVLSSTWASVGFNASIQPLSLQSVVGGPTLRARSNVQGERWKIIRSRSALPVALVHWHPQCRGLPCYKSRWNSSSPAHCALPGEVGFLHFVDLSAEHVTSVGRRNWGKIAARSRWLNSTLLRDMVTGGRGTGSMGTGGRGTGGIGGPLAPGAGPPRELSQLVRARALPALEPSGSANGAWPPTDHRT